MRAFEAQSAVGDCNSSKAAVEGEMPQDICDDTRMDVICGSEVGLDANQARCLLACSRVIKKVWPRSSNHGECPKDDVVI